MKATMLHLIALAVTSGTALLAQSLVGTWQASIKVGGATYRMVFKISTTDGDSLKAVLYPAIDQSGQGIPAGAVTLRGSAVTIAVPGIGGSYAGKMSPDGATIAGTWTMGDQAVTMTLMRATAQSAWTIPEPPARLRPMAAGANPAFEVATIKPSRPDQPKSIGVNGRQMTTHNTSVSDLITFAYGMHPRQVTGGPAWLESEKYDLQGEPDLEGAPNDRQVKIMFQKMLADRFQLTFHRDKKELSVYTLSVGKTGAKLTKNESDPNGLPGLGFRGLGALTAINATMWDFANAMQTLVLDRPVVDRTGLPGHYDFALNWTPDEFQFMGLGIKPPPPPDSAANPDLYTAIEQQLGLKLESTRVPVEIIVIDHVERPSAN